MDVFSLEEEDGNEVFLTQKARQDTSVNNYGIIGDEMDFSSPCVGLVSSAAQYSDISDDNFQPIPCFQKGQLDTFEDSG